MKKKKKAFTLIELMIVVSIIVILTVTVLVNIIQSKKNARINNTKTTLKNAVLMVISCNDSGSPVNTPSGVENGAKTICPSFSNAFWPQLQGGYSYVAGGDFGSDCRFRIDTNGDSVAYLLCTCASGICN